MLRSSGLLLVLVPCLLITGCQRPADPPVAATPAEAPPAVSKEVHVPPPPLAIPNSVAVLTDIGYGGADADPIRHRLDLYLPKTVASFPTLVFLHGGGYQRGDRSVGRNLGVVLANHGIAVASISYRLYPQVRHPGQIEDAARAFAWVKRHIAECGGDPAKVHVGGHSAGAHLASLLGSDPGYLDVHGLALADIASVVAISGGYRINPIRKDVFGSDAAMAAASPFAHLGPGRPPFHLLFGSLEKPERHALSRELRDALLAAGGQAACIEIADRDHQGLLDQVGEGDPVATAVINAIGH